MLKDEEFKELITKVKLVLEEIEYEQVKLENETKAKDKQMELHQTKQFLHIKENYQQNEKAAYKKWKKIFANDTLNKGLNTQNIHRTHKIQHQKTKSGQRISTDIFPKIYRYPTDIKDTQHY